MNFPNFSNTNGNEKNIFQKEENNVNNNYPYYPQQPRYMESMTNQVNQFMGIKGRPVSSLEEARATSIDFDGSIFYFPDLANRRIYTKQVNLDGTATLNVYEQKELPEIQPYVTREEFNQVIEQIKQMFAAAAPKNPEPSGTDRPQTPTYNF